MRSQGFMEIVRGTAVPGLFAVALLSMASDALAQQYDCLIEPQQVVELRSSVEGLIEQVLVQRGDTVRRGQVLVELQSRAERLGVESSLFRSRMEAPILTAQNRINYATRKFARADELQKENLVSTQARDEADAELRLAQSELKAALENRELARIEHERAAEQLALRTLRSPLDGVVVDRMLNPGDLSESGAGRKPVLKLAQIDPLRVDVVLPASVFGRVRPGARAVVVTQGGARHQATVRLVDMVVDAASGTLVARLELPNRERAVASGVRCKAEFETPLSGAAGASAQPRPSRP